MKDKFLKYMVACLCVAAIGAVQSASALTFSLSGHRDDLFGEMRTVTVHPGDNFAKLARRYDMGYYELIEANPNVDPDYPHPGTTLVIPSQFILPNVPHKGMVLNLAEMRLYYFPPGGHEVRTYPIGIGRQDWATPQGKMKIIEKRTNPIWYVPKSIREARLEDGVELPEKVMPGPDNPLGKYAMRLSNRTYLIHSTNQPSGVGRRSSSGCIRMFPEDIEQLFPMIKIDTPVRIIDAPYKVGWRHNTMYLEAHYPLQEHFEDFNVDEDDTAIAVQVIEDALHRHDGHVDWPQALFVARERMGVPQPIGRSWRARG